jgi:DNA mismatch endonuclease (patch repair protein)
MDTLTPEHRSKVMASVRGHGNHSTELRMLALFRQSGITGWRRRQKIFGRPDFVFRRQKVALFIDGDYWHGHPKHGRIPKSNVEFWTSKITANRRRDRVVNSTLRSSGWIVVRVWESTLKKNPTSVLYRVRSALAGTENSRSALNR